MGMDLGIVGRAGTTGRGRVGEKRGTAGGSSLSQDDRLDKAIRYLFLPVVAHAGRGINQTRLTFMHRLIFRQSEVRALGMRVSLAQTELWYSLQGETRQTRAGQ
jgi:hypothetical protein